MVLSACAVYIYTEYEGEVSVDTRTNSGTALSVVGAPQRGRGPCTSSCTVCVVLCVAGNAVGNRNTGGVEYSEVRRERRQQRYLRCRGRPLFAIVVGRVTSSSSSSSFYNLKRLCRRLLHDIRVRLLDVPASTSPGLLRPS